jgi:N-acetylglucosamine malate deacetylase 2
MSVDLNFRGRRAAIVAAHPDDETLGLGGCLEFLKAPTIIHVTDGAPQDMRDASDSGFHSREDYAQARRSEFLDCLKAGGIHITEAIALNFIDQEASLHLTKLARELSRLFGRLKIDLVFTHPYEGGHPDHDATAFGVYAACGLLPRSARPEVVEFTSYHINHGQMETGVFLPADGVTQVSFRLSAQARERKQRMLACYRSQVRVLQHFSIEEERFRSAPEYDFRKPPHPGPLFYEQFPWGMTGAKWTWLARSAQDTLEPYGKSASSLPTASTNLP